MVKDESCDKDENASSAGVSALLSKPLLPYTLGILLFEHPLINITVGPLILHSLARPFSGVPGFLTAIEEDKPGPREAAAGKMLRSPGDRARRTDGQYTPLNMPSDGAGM